MSKHISCEKREARNRKRKLACKEKASTPKKQMRTPQLKDCISSFKSKIKEGPYFICSVCDRMLYRRTCQEVGLR